MTIMSHIREAAISLRNTRLRTGLTTLGIIIGVLSITLVLALAEGSKRTLVDQIAELDKGIILAQPGGDEPRSVVAAYSPFSTSAASTLTERDTQSITALDQLNAIAPIMYINGSLKHNDKLVKNISIVATSPDLVGLLKLELASGQFLSPTTNRNTVVLGYTAAIELLGTDQVRGQEVIVKGRPHTVIGVIKNTRSLVNAVGINIDRSALISLEDGKSFNQGIAQISQVVMRAKDPTAVASTAASIDQKIISNHDGERDFSVIEGKNVASRANSSYSLIMFITAAVASVALVVGGIGIMNIMLVSVTERTREIGIRKALGASNGQIMMQFLVESLTMTIVGGIIGLVLAYLAAFIIATLFAFQPALTWQIVEIAMGLAVAVGVAFGMYPALKASRKDPIEALRQYE